jgi:hypothetical protein
MTREAKIFLIILMSLILILSFYTDIWGILIVLISLFIGLIVIGGLSFVISSLRKYFSPDECRIE